MVKVNPIRHDPNALFRDAVEQKVIPDTRRCGDKEVCIVDYKAAPGQTKILPRCNCSYVSTPPANCRFENRRYLPQLGNNSRDKCVNTDLMTMKNGYSRAI